MEGEVTPVKVTFLTEGYLHNCLDKHIEILFGRREEKPGPKLSQKEQDKVFNKIRGRFFDQLHRKSTVETRSKEALIGDEATKYEMVLSQSVEAAISFGATLLDVKPESIIHPAMKICA